MAIRRTVSGWVNLPIRHFLGAMDCALVGIAISALGFALVVFLAAIGFVGPRL
jgi:hypothetical protein